MIGKIVIEQNFDALREFHRNALFIGTMHFMDRYNYDLETCPEVVQQSPAVLPYTLT
jgi:uncharacterized radical SAM superfamily Fe-S cluster-containing enzyme